MTNFDKREAFDTLVREKLDEIRAICSSEGIPFFFSFCVANDEFHSDYVNDGVMTGSRGIELADDQIVKHLLICRGFDAVPDRNDVEIMMDDYDTFDIPTEVEL